MDANLNSYWAFGRAWIGMAAICLLPAAAGCMCQKGIELRGDWALQLNHVPWDEAACHGVGPASHAGHALADGSPEAALPIAPVHRFHPVPMAPVTHPQGAAVPEPAGSPPTAAVDQQPQPVFDAADGEPPSDDLPPQPVSVLKPYSGPSEPAWVFRPQPTSNPGRAVSDRRRLSSGWQAAPTRR